MAKRQITRKWEMFAGRNRFFCDGRLMLAPNSNIFIFTLLLITGTNLIFFIYDCPYLAENVTVAIPITGALLFLFTMSALLRTSFTDPGIIPRATSDEAAYVEQQIEVTNSSNSPTYRPPPRTKEVIVKGQTVKLKYCFTCKIFRPPRASHCSLCDNCVDRFDHHCPWVGNCVGRRNYRFFYMFIVSLAFLAVFIFACAITHILLVSSEENGKFLEAVKKSPASLVVASICFLSIWSIVGLAGFHTYLTTSNQTTNEDIKGSFAAKPGQEPFNPYSQGNVCLNCLQILCGPLGPSLIDRRGIVTDEYKAELSKAKHPITEQVHFPQKLYGLPIAPVSINNTPPITNDMPGVYRQTTENTGAYYSHYPPHHNTPVRKAKASPKAHQIVPTPPPPPAQQRPYIAYPEPLPPMRAPYHRQPVHSSSLPQLPPQPHCPAAVAAAVAASSRDRSMDQIYAHNPNANRGAHFDRYYDCDPSERAYTPPEKRYSASFGMMRPPSRGEYYAPVVAAMPPANGNHRRIMRPHSSGFVYQNVHADDGFCTNSDCPNNQNRRGVYNIANANHFPKPEFSRLYIQDNFG